VRKWALLLLIPLTAAAVVVFLGVGGSSEPGAERAAREDAQRRLDSFAPPPDAEEVGSVPGEPRLSGPGERTDSANFFFVGRTWVDAEPVAQVRRWLQGAAPTGSRLIGTGYSGGGGRSTIWDYMYQYPDLKGVSEGRSVEVSVTKHESGSALRADAKGVWVEPRPTSSLIPTGVRVIAIERELLRGGALPHPTGIVERGLIRDRSEVASVVAAVNGFETPQRGTHSCEIEEPRYLIRLRFLPRVGGEPLAATEMNWPYGFCSYLSLRVEGEPQPSLSEGWILHRRLGANLKRLH
jgi:hypothetical protein